jgi:3-methyladenine DNA glycosylase AlkD
MINSDLYQQIVSFCKQNANPELVVKYSRYFTEGYDSYGISQTLFNEQIKLLTQNPELSLHLILETAPLLLASGKYEETSFAIILCKKYSKQFTNQTLDEIEKWFSIGIQNWAHADVMSSEILSVFLLKDIVPLTRFSSWIQSPHRFQRRTVPVTLIKLLKNNTVYEPYFELIEQLMTDKEKVVHQGVGWFLREAWKKQPEATEKFLLKYKDVSARLLIQYATEKMSKEDKLRFKRDK